MEPDEIEDLDSSLQIRQESQARYRVWEMLRGSDPTAVAAAYIEWEKAIGGVELDRRPDEGSEALVEGEGAIALLLDLVEESIAGRSSIGVTQSRQLLAFIARVEEVSPEVLLRTALLLESILEQEPSGGFRTIAIVLKRLDSEVVRSRQTVGGVIADLAAVRDRLVRRAEDQPDGYVVSLRRLWLAIDAHASDDVIRHHVGEAQAKGPGTLALLMVAVADWIAEVEQRLGDAFAAGDPEAVLREAGRLLEVLPEVDHKVLRRLVGEALWDVNADAARVFMSYAVLAGLVDRGVTAVRDLVPRYLFPRRPWKALQGAEAEARLDESISRLRDALSAAAEGSAEYQMIQLRFDLSTLAVARDLDGAIERYRELQNLNVVTPEDVGWMITAHMRAPVARTIALARALEFGCGILESGGSIPAKPMRNMLVAASRALTSPTDEELHRNLFRFRRLVDDANGAGLEPNARLADSDLVVHEATIQGWRTAAAEEVERARDAIVSVRGRLDTYQFGFWVRSLLRNGELERALVEVRAHAESGEVLNTHHVTELIKDLARTSRFEDLEDVLSRMITSGGSPDAILMQVVISGYSDAGLVDEAARMLRGLPEHGLEADPIHYGALMQGLAHLGLTDEVRALLGEMSRLGLPVTARHQQTVAVSCAVNGSLDAALAALDEFGLADGSDEVALRAVARAVARTDDPAALFSWAELIGRRIGTEPLSVVDVAGEIDAEMDVPAFEAFMASLLEAVPVGSPRSLGLVCALGARTLRSLGSVDCVVEHVISELDRVRDQTIDASELGRLASIVHGTRSVTLARRMIEMEERQATPPSPFRTGAAMLALGSAGLSDDCERLLARVRDSQQLAPKDELYLLNLLLAALRRAGRTEEVRRVYREMSENGPEPDSYTIAAVTAAGGID